MVQVEEVLSTTSPNSGNGSIDLEMGEGNCSAGWVDGRGSHHRRCVEEGPDSSDDSLEYNVVAGTAYQHNLPAQTQQVAATTRQEYTGAVRGKTTLDRRRHTTRASVFGGSNATREHAFTVLLDTGSLATFMKDKVWQRTISYRAVSSNGFMKIAETKWGGFHGRPLIPSSRVCIYVQMRGASGVAVGDARALTVCLAAHAHAVPFEAMTHWIYFRTRQLGSFSSWKLRLPQPYQNCCHFDRSRK